MTPSPGLRYVRATDLAFLLTASGARDIIDVQVQTIRDEWVDAADAARLTSSERDRLWRRQILIDFAFESDQRVTSIWSELTSTYRPKKVTS